MSSILNTAKNILIGKPLHNNQLHGEKMNVFWGLPIMASDAISSVAYAVEEILWVLIAVAGLAAYRYSFVAAAAIIVLLLILVVSYRQTIDHYPGGGGSYTVARENLGEIPGLTACAALIIGYVLTVAVSCAAGTAAITSAVPALRPYTVVITLGMIALMTIGNLRGIKESARIFAIPTYVFIAAMLLMIGTGLVKSHVLHIEAVPLYDMPKAMGDITLFLVVRAFAAGCAGLTGVEAVSNAVPSFSEPAQKNAKRVLALMGLCVVLIFGGTSYMTTLYHAVPTYEATVLSQIGQQIFGQGIMYYVLQIATAVILVMAANTAYAGLPPLLSLAAHDGYVPRQFNTRGGRLSFSNGIILLGVAAGVLVVIFNSDTHRLVPMYAIGVFLTFSLSQLGMLRKWLRERGPGWQRGAVINGFGLAMTVVTVAIIAMTRMKDGAWISLVGIAVLIVLMKITHAHYTSRTVQLGLRPEEAHEVTESIKVSNRVIVLIHSLTKASLKAISYAMQLMPDENITVLHVAADEENAEALREKWEACEIPLPLVIREAPYRDIMEPLVSYIESEEHGYQPGEMLTVVMPQGIQGSVWRNVYHDQTAYTIRRRLLRDRHIAVVVVPYVLEG